MIKSCEEAGSRQIDVKKLNAVLNAELAALQGTAALSQRPFIAQEIRVSSRLLVQIGHSEALVIKYIIRIAIQRILGLTSSVRADALLVMCV